MSLYGICNNYKAAIDDLDSLVKADRIERLYDFIEAQGKCCDGDDFIPTIASYCLRDVAMNVFIPDDENKNRKANVIGHMFYIAGYCDAENMIDEVIGELSKAICTIAGMRDAGFFSDQRDKVMDVVTDKLHEADRHITEAKKLMR